MVVGIFLFHIYVVKNLEKLRSPAILSLFGNKDRTAEVENSSYIF
jgi:hypothetical protein